MSLSEQTMLDLMAYADGELDGGSAKRVEKLIARDEEARKVLEAMQTLTECLHVVEGARPAPTVDVDGIVDSVMKTVSTMPVPVDEERPRRLMRGVAAGVASALIAIAAGWALFSSNDHPTPDQLEAIELLRAHHEQAVPDPEPPAPTATPAELAATDPDPEPTPAAPEQGGVELDHVESPSHEVAVFYVPALADSAENASTSVVVWIGDNQRGL